MKKKILALCLVVVLVATAITGVTLAYFTDTDIETNTFTIGNVEIDLEENYVQDSELMPGMDVTKEAQIKNTGANGAWVWAEVLVPKILDDGIVNEPTAPGLENSLHVNYPGANAKEYAQNTNADGKYYNAELSDLWIHKSNSNGLKYGYKGVETVGDIEYNVYVKLYEDVLPAGETTSLFMNKVYMDATVKQCDVADCSCGGNGMTLYGGSCYNGEWNIIVRGYAIQEEGFDKVEDAYAAFDGKLLDREQNPDNGPTA